MIGVSFACNMLTITQPGSAVVRVQLFDMTGLLLRNIDERVAGIKAIDMDGYTQGSYVVRVSGKFGQKTIRIVIK